MIAVITETVSFLTLIAAVFVGLLQWIILEKLIKHSNFNKGHTCSLPPEGAYNVIVNEPPLQGYIKIGNSGQSIARNVRRYMTVGIDPASGGPPDIDDINTMTKEKRELQLSLRRFIRPSSANCPEEPQSAAKMLRRSTVGKQKPIDVYGTIFYDDIFGNPHTTQFCHMYFGPEYGRWFRQRLRALPAEILRTP